MGSALGLVHLTATLPEVRGHGVSARTCSSHCQSSVTGCDGTLDPQFLSQCGCTVSCQRRSVPKIYSVCYKHVKQPTAGSGAGGGEGGGGVKEKRSAVVERLQPLIIMFTPACLESCSDWLLHDARS